MTVNKSADNPPAEVVPFTPEEDASSNVSRRVRVRLRVINIALKMFNERGYKNVTVSDIADIAGMSQRTFFRYFDTKEDVLFFWMDWQGEVISEALAQEGSEPRPLRALRRSFIYLAELNERSKYKARKLVTLIFSTPELRNRYYADHLKWQEKLVDIIAEGRELGDDQRFKLKAQVSVAISLYVMVIQTWASETAGALRQPEMISRAYDALEEDVFSREYTAPGD